MFSYFLGDGYTYSTLVPVTLRVDYPLDAGGWTADLEQDQFRIYPNPGTGLFYVQGISAGQGGWLTVTDPSGREILHEPLPGDRTEINLEHVLPGMYIFNIVVDHHQENHRVIVQ